MRIHSRHRHESSKRTTAVAVVLSALLHLPLIFLIYALKPDSDALDQTNFDAQSAFEIDVVSDTEEPEEEPQPEEEEDAKQLQYVSLPKPEVEERPEEADYADRFDEKVDEQTVKKALPGSQARATPPPTPTPLEKTNPEDSEGDIEEEAAKEPSPERDLDESGVSATAEQKEAAPAQKPTPDALFPAIDDARASEIVGGGGSLDYLRDVAEGDKTLLNRKRTRYWAFFDRVKRQVSKQWTPVTEYRKRDPYGNVFGVKDRYSAVDVTLNGDGSVRRLYLSRGSGLEFFDDEAVRAIKSAAPFHNPPEGLKDEDGLVHFTFGFYFEISSGRFRFMRIRN